MKTVFAKYNYERLPKFQIITEIVVDEQGSRFAVKRAGCAEASEHLQRIYDNYSLLSSSHDIGLVKPTKTADCIRFKIAKGVSLESIFIDAYERRDYQKIQKYFDLYLKLIDKLVSKRNQRFSPCEKFTEVFGKYESDVPQDIVGIANVDLIFGNIFVDENDSFTLIDYEWVFDFDVPKDFIIFRAIQANVISHNIDFSEYCYFRKDNDLYERYLQMNKSFMDYVCGKYKKYLLNRSILMPNVNIFLDVQRKNQLIEEEEQKIENLSSQLNQVYNSTSWKITKPFRWVVRYIRKQMLK